MNINAEKGRNRQYDVIVIGSGPAGCAAAITCVQAGLSVMLVTDKPGKVTVPILPLESIHPGISSLLDKLQGSGIIVAASMAPYLGVQTGDKISPLGEDENGTWVGNHINRSLFDTELLKSAIRQGVAVMENEKLTQLIEENNWIAGVKTSSGYSLYARYIIDASGYKRVAGKKLNFKEQFFSPPLVSWTGIAGGINEKDTLFNNGFAKFIPHKGGWTWLAPQPPDLCTWTRLSVKTRQDYIPPLELEKYEQVGKIRVVNMRWRVFRPLCKEGIILCGDAAGILDPASGQGILQALYSGMMAGNTVLSIIADPDKENVCLAFYDNWFMEQYMKKAERLSNYYLEHGIQIPEKARIIDY